eukprot:6213311-Pleurochrysis_carterae.AAC.3
MTSRKFNESLYEQMLPTKQKATQTLALFHHKHKCTYATGVHQLDRAIRPNRDATAILRVEHSRKFVVASSSLKHACYFRKKSGVVIDSCRSSSLWCSINCSQACLQQATVMMRLENVKGTDGWQKRGDAARTEEEKIHVGKRQASRKVQEDKKKENVQQECH